METADLFETSVYIGQIKRRSIPEDIKIIIFI
jgi:hypothetical protein